MKTEKITTQVSAQDYEKEFEDMRAAKRRRLRAILEYARSENYTTQGELCDWLYARGCGCNQGQLSKDLDRLGLAPYIDRRGNKRLGRRTYILTEQLEERYVKILQEATLGVETFDNMIVITTIAGCAQAVATVLESACWREVLSISYGMSSVTVMCLKDSDADEITDRIREGIL